MYVEMKIGSITLRIYGDTLMLYQEDGEGMEIGKGELESLLQEYYASNF